MRAKDVEGYTQHDTIYTNFEIHDSGFLWGGWERRGWN